MLTDREIAIYSLGKTEGINSIAETLGKGLDDEKYIESWNKTMKLLGIKMPLKELEKIYNEFAKKNGKHCWFRRTDFKKPEKVMKNQKIHKQHYWIRHKTGYLFCGICKKKQKEIK